MLVYRAPSAAAVQFERVDRAGRLIEKIGADNVMFETDFPHPVSLYDATVPATIDAGLADCPADVRRKLLWSNAQKLYAISEPTAADERKLREAV